MATTITRSVPSITKYQSAKSGTPVVYNNNIALSNAFNSFVLLSGGSSVRSTTTTVGGDETWQILSLAGLGGSAKYGDLVKLALPNHSSVLLSGGTSVRTTTTTVGPNETWQLVGAFYDRTGQPVMYGDLVALTLPQTSSLLLSGGSSVRTTTTAIGPDECWMLLCLTP